MASDNALARSYNESINRVLQRTDYSGNGGLGAAQSAIMASGYYTPSSSGGVGTFDNTSGKTSSSSSGSSSGSSSLPSSSSSGGFDMASYLEAINAQRRADAEAAFNRARNSLNSAYNDASKSYSNIYSSGVDQLGRSYDNSRGKINQNATDAFREAYVNRMLSEKNLGQRLAAMGMSGGASESAMAGLINNYGNSRNGIQRTLDTNLGDLEMNYQSNLSDLYNAYQTNMAALANQRASQLANLELQLANLNSNMGGDYYSALMSNAGALQSAANQATKAQAAYEAPETAQATNTFTPANVQQANDVGGTLTNWWKDQIEKMRANGATDYGIVQNLVNQGLTDAQIRNYMYA